MAKVPKTPPKYPKCHAHMLAKLPKIPPNYPKCRKITQHVLPCPYSMRLDGAEAEAAARVARIASLVGLYKLVELS
jgi:hypothetical protein